MALGLYNLYLPPYDPRAIGFPHGPRAIGFLSLKHATMALGPYGFIVPPYGPRTIWCVDKIKQHMDLGCM